MKLAFSGFFMDSSGYGTAAMRLVRALEAAGNTVGPLFSVTDGEHGMAGPGVTFATGAVAEHWTQHLIFAIADQYPHFTSVPGPHIGLTTWETSVLPEAMVAGCQRVDHVWVPSQHNVAVFEAAGIPVELARIPSEAFVFYTVGTWQERKNLLGLVTAFLTSFAGNETVELVIKTHGNAPWLVSELQRHQATLNLRGPSPTITLITRALSDDEIWGLHQRGDCFVSLTRGEAYGLPILDAAVSENPLIVSRTGGYLDYLADQPGVMYVDGRMAPVVQAYPLFSADQQWFDPDLLQAMASMREALTLRGRRFKRTFADLTPEVVGRRIMELLTHGHRSR